MEKLELKHLAPYLPYGLKLYHSGYKAKHILEASIKEGVYDREMSAVTLTAMVNDNEYLKPILRPLSDLTKEIEHNGEKFVPVDRLEWNSYDHIIKKGMCDNVGYQYMIKLFEWHFDVFGLIEKGLAIDINTIQEGETKQ